MATEQDRVSLGQRALWTFLIGTLVGPFFAAVLLAIIVGTSIVFGWGPASLKAVAPHQAGPVIAQYAITAYVWGAIPAAIAAALASAWLALRGSLPWLAVAIVAGISATVGAVLTGGMAALHVTPIAAIAATAGCAVWMVLRRAGIVPASSG
jgi:hypothetical protein